MIEERQGVQRGASARRAVAGDPTASGGQVEVRQWIILRRDDHVRVVALKLLPVAGAARPQMVLPVEGAGGAAALRLCVINLSPPVVLAVHATRLVG